MSVRESPGTMSGKSSPVRQAASSSSTKMSAKWRLTPTDTTPGRDSARLAVISAVHFATYSGSQSWRLR